MVSVMSNSQMGRCGDYSGVGPLDSVFGPNAMFDQETGSETSEYWELCRAGYKNHKRIKKLKRKIDDLEDDVQATLDGMDNEDVEWDSRGKFGEQLFVVDGKLQKYKRRLEKAERKSRAIRNALSGQ